MKLTLSSLINQLTALLATSVVFSNLPRAGQDDLDPPDFRRSYITWKSRMPLERNPELAKRNLIIKDIENSEVLHSGKEIAHVCTTDYAVDWDEQEKACLR